MSAHKMYEIQAYKALRCAVQEERDVPKWIASLLAAVCGGTDGGMSAIIDAAPKTYEREALAEFLREIGCDQSSQQAIDQDVAASLERDDAEIQERLDQ